MEKESDLNIQKESDANSETNGKCKLFFLSVDKKTVEHYVAITTARAMSVKERLRQKTEKVVDSVPVLRTVYHKVDDFDNRMTARHGQTYVKIRDGINSVARTVVAAQLFGGWGIVGACAYEMYESAAAFLEPAEKARREGKVKGIFDYLKKNKEEAAVSTTNSVLKVASMVGKVMGAVGLRKMAYAGKALLFVGSNVVKKVREARNAKKAEKTKTEEKTQEKTVNSEETGKISRLLKVKNGKNGR